MKTAIITGASGSIGQAIIDRLIIDNWFIIAHKFNSVINCNSENINWIYGDFSNKKGINEFIKSIDICCIDRKIDLFVHCAAIQIKGTPISIEDCEKLSSINLIAPYHISEAIIKYMTYGSSMVFISSICADKATIGAEFYGATKAGINSLVRSLAYRYGQIGIRVNGIEPSIVKSRQTEEVWQNFDFISKIKRQNPFNRLANTVDIADLVLLVSNEKARWLTGQVLIADGGSFLGYGEIIWDK
jgi:NAD(P)-dependent dehydrogenase (short-subunit alcohol dehydrogenase family)